MTANAYMWSELRMLVEELARAVTAITVVVCAAMILLLTVLLAAVVTNHIRSWLAQERATGRSVGKPRTDGLPGSARWIASPGASRGAGQETWQAALRRN